jgi:hypothetical protein
VHLQEKEFSDFEKTAPLKNQLKYRYVTPIKDKFSEKLKGMNFNNVAYLMSSKRNTQTDAKWINELRFHGKRANLSYIAKNDYSFKA